MTKTVSLETAKLLKEAGWPQDIGQMHVTKEPFPSGDKYISAPDVSELLEALTCEEMRLYAIKIPKSQGGGKEYLAYPIHQENICGRSKNPAESLALLWLELKKQNLL